MSTMLDHVDLDRISAEAQEVHIGRMLLTLIGAILYALGWTAGTMLTVLWLVIAWSFMAVKLGWQDARASRMRPRRAVGPA